MLKLFLLFSRFVYVPSLHTKDFLTYFLVDCFLEWNIDRKLSTVIVDNCSTNDAIMKLHLNKLDISSLMLHGQNYLKNYHLTYPTNYNIA